MKRMSIFLLGIVFSLRALDNSPSRASSSMQPNDVVKKKGSAYRPNIDQLKSHREKLLAERTEVLRKYKKNKNNKDFVAAQSELLMRLADNLEFMQALLDLLRPEIEGDLDKNTLTWIDVKDKPWEKKANAIEALECQEEFFKVMTKNAQLLQLLIDRGIELLE